MAGNFDVSYLEESLPKMLKALGPQALTGKHPFLGLHRLKLPPENGFVHTRSKELRKAIFICHFLGNDFS